MIDEMIKVSGTVLQCHGKFFSVKLDGPGDKVIQAHKSGKMIRSKRGKNPIVRIVPGDTVDLELSPYDLTKGIIIWRR